MGGLLLLHAPRLGSVAATRLGLSDLLAGTATPQVMIGDQWFTVIGILHSITLNPDIDRAALIGWNAARTLLHFDGHATVIYLQAQEDYIEAVRAVLPATVDPQHPSDVQVTAPSDALAAKRATQTSFWRCSSAWPRWPCCSEASESPTPW